MSLCCWLAGVVMRRACRAQLPARHAPPLSSVSPTPPGRCCSQPDKLASCEQCLRLLAAQLWEVGASGRAAAYVLDRNRGLSVLLRAVLAGAELAEASAADNSWQVGGGRAHQARPCHPRSVPVAQLACPVQPACLPHVSHGGSTFPCCPGAGGPLDRRARVSGLPPAGAELHGGGGRGHEQPPAAPARVRAGWSAWRGGCHAAAPPEAAIATLLPPLFRPPAAAPAMPPASLRPALTPAARCAP